MYKRQQNHMGRRKVAKKSSDAFNSGGAETENRQKPQHLSEKGEEQHLAKDGEPGGLAVKTDVFHKKVAFGLKAEHSSLDHHLEHESHGESCGADAKSLHSLLGKGGVLNGGTLPIGRNGGVAELRQFV